MELGAQPQVEIQLGADPVKPAATLQLASMSRRLMAAVVDGALITGAFLGAVMLFAPSVHELPSMKSIEAGTILALFAIGILYQLFFSTFAEATPGMIYAGISLCTFDDQCPDCSRRLSRLGALLLSLIPMGLGAAWAVFDEEHLSWHDRLSKTYQRQC